MSPIAAFDPQSAAAVSVDPSLPLHPSGTPMLFSPDTGDDGTLGRAASAGFLAELVAHRHAGTPLVLAILGPAGSGRSSFMRRIVGAVASLAGGDASGPFLADVVTARVDAGTGGDPVRAITDAVLTAVADRHPAMTEDALNAGRDPVAAAEAAAERVNDLRRKLDGERLALDELNGRSARLADSVLFESAGSQVDAYARTNRGRIEARLRSFGLSSGDPVTTYKELVRDVAGAPGGAARFGYALRALWAYKGQGTLLFLTVLFLVLGATCTVLAGDTAGLDTALAGSGDRLAALAGWARSHLELLAPSGEILLALAALTLLADVVRAVGFVQPVFRGAALLKTDLGNRRRDLDGLLAHQTRRVDQFAAEVESAARAAEAAERRAETRRGGPVAARIDLAGKGLVPPDAPEDRPAAFFASLSTAMTEAPVALSGPTDPPRPVEHLAPARIVVVVDGLDRLTPAAAAAFLEAAHRLVARPGFVTLVAFERGHLASGLAETDPALAASRLDRLVQLSYDLGAEPIEPSRFAGGLLSGAAPETGRSLASGRQVGASRLDKPWDAHEQALVEALAPFAGSTPRRVKRFVNTYRVARADPRLAEAGPGALAGLASALALDQSGAAAGFAAWGDATSTASMQDAGPDLRLALDAAQRALGAELTEHDARQGFAVARSFSGRG